MQKYFLLFGICGVNFAAKVPIMGSDSGVDDNVPTDSITEQHPDVVPVVPDSLDVPDVPAEDEIITYANETVPASRSFWNWNDVDTCSVFESDCCDESVCDYMNKYANGVCNTECNKRACGYDGGDCNSNNKYFKLTNHCDLSIDVAVRYQKYDGTWESKCWYEINPSYTTTLYSGTVPLVSSNRIWYVYAEVRSGLYVWGGDNEKGCGLRTLPFRKVTGLATDSAWHYTFTCGAF
ncbi:hypothetical protein SARC_15471 [Sphaeroforma arctica JP610]|uniref:LNR domain-containing protein n=1 Tax=Sphaeroforma arctica JP610 TaxID=667725 RepID=A0A0L0F5W6_9EUKA|nr:hypothetical protein SARC_15471 [Sphaeroforma arctica JP610]KNC71981.1 hypothetical protein SARC_15471 [Sphaeroforma arctica JP610]|eukprot:XP_014145883.1 hypothetical protein SARC_15471 [Sphaeroforma arctica JP610]